MMKSEAKISVRISNFYCGVLIIGSGSAGLRAAIEAKDRGAQVIIVSKSKSNEPHTVLARGGINAALGTMDPEDSWIAPCCRHTQRRRVSSGLQKSGDTMPKCS